MVFLVISWVFCLIGPTDTQSHTHETMMVRIPVIKEGFSRLWTPEDFLKLAKKGPFAVSFQWRTWGDIQVIVQCSCSLCGLFPYVCFSVLRKPKYGMVYQFSYCSAHNWQQERRINVLSFYMREQVITWLCAVEIPAIINWFIKGQICQSSSFILLRYC